MRADDSERLLAGYVSGPAAASEATAAALTRADAARTVALVEGVSPGRITQPSPPSELLAGRSQTAIFEVRGGQTAVWPARLARPPSAY